MTCQNCHQDSWVTIGAKKYCTNCGSLASPPTIVAGMTDVRGPAAVHKEAVSAQSLHATSALASGGVLDLRQPKPVTPAAPTVTQPASFTDIAPAPKPAPTPTPAPDPILVVAPQPAPPVAQPKPEPTPTPAPAPQPALTPALVPKPQPTLSEMAKQLSSPAEDLNRETKQASRRPVSIAAGAAVVLILGGYIWMSNYNNLSIRTASQRAGIVASLPQYTPSGYKLDGPISYGTGFVSFNLKNPKESNKSIAVIQRKSDWDSASLLELYVTPKTKDYIAVDSQGLKIYLYGNGQATWVNKGLQYVVQANSGLSRDQIVKMAGSL